MILCHKGAVLTVEDLNQPVAVWRGFIRLHIARHRNPVTAHEHHVGGVIEMVSVDLPLPDRCAGPLVVGTNQPIAVARRVKAAPSAAGSNHKGTSLVKSDALRSVETT